MGHCLHCVNVKVNVSNLLAMCAPGAELWLRTFLCIVEWCLMQDPFVVLPEGESMNSMCVIA